jgi:hypothetical protein
LNKAGDVERSKRSFLGALQHDGAASSERRAKLPCEHHKREVPRDDLLSQILSKVDGFWEI